MFRIVSAVLLFVSALVHGADTQPNIVLIVSDDHAWNDYGFMGHAQIKTPNLDRLAAESLTFKRGYVPSSLCCPSLATIITGQYPHQHKVTSNDPPMPKGLKRGTPEWQTAFQNGRELVNQNMDRARTLPRVLSEHGYLSFQSGKWWQGDFKRGGFTHGMSRGQRHGDAGLDIGRKTMQPIYDFIAESRTAGKPFMVWYAPMMPHDPHTPPERLLNKYKDSAPSIHVARYWAMIEWFDETCGQLLDHLDKNGLRENTIIAYVADNGWIQNPKEPRYAERSKQSQYDGGVRSPILLRWPGKIAPATPTQAVSSIDLLPTLLKAAGVPCPAGLPGIDLRDSSAIAARETIYGTCYTHDFMDLEKPAKSVRWRWCLSGEWKLIVPNLANEPNGVVELYNLDADPFEQKNLAASEPARVAALRGKLDEWWKGE